MKRAEKQRVNFDAPQDQLCDFSFFFARMYPQAANAGTTKQKRRRRGKRRSILTASFSVCYFYSILCTGEKMKYSAAIRRCGTGRLISLILLHILACFAAAGGAGPAIQGAGGSQITISVQTDQKSVPLNRTIELKVTLSWIGGSEAYAVMAFENPQLTNFEIVGTATSSRTQLVDGQTHVFKDYVYTLKPLELGMGYVDGAIVKIHDNKRDRDETLSTQRFPVEVTDPVPERGEGGMGAAYFLFPLAVLALGTGLFFLLKKRKEGRKTSPEDPVPPLESRMLDELRRRFDLSHPDLKEDFSRLSKLLRRYLAERFSLPAMEQTTTGLLDSLEETSLEQNQAAGVKEILSRCDEIKFSGAAGSEEELTRFYTIFEGILEKGLRRREDETGMQQK
jgi:hypothetical protein